MKNSASTPSAAAPSAGAPPAAPAHARFRDQELRHWPTDEAAARAVQDRLRPYVRQDASGPAPDVIGIGSRSDIGRGSGGGTGADTGTVVGVDVAYDDDHDIVAAAAVALDAHTLTVVDEATAVGRISFPYVPGLLAFREIPTVLAALDRLARTPDLVVCDGYGLAHPRRFGLASHLGVLTGLPTIGVAKNPFTFRYEQPAPERGATAPLLDGDEEVGRALRTQKGIKPVFVSVGHRTTLDRACAYTLRLAATYRLPETTRAADALCRRALTEAQGAERA